ncbi:MAG: NB-ARC domain-containing protein [Nostoc sp. DedSLP03]|uniref:NB-ARC domain-containing protein n=1 Tax=Nostoc sp. DedSLP03 TaxID=3075400 RepID=UPI002AD4C0D6|nr:NB-ARC domain-containing protein [Nostoc sp. DedSLP03]MDZ7965549.1 NB-ARC domain-containing protein [Nostoc sp. DedSLP03]
MALTMRLSDKGKLLIEQARTQKGWTKIDVTWRQEAGKLLKQQGVKILDPSESTLRRFQDGAGIRPEMFKAFCGAVGVDWSTTIITDDIPESPSAIPKLESQFINVLRPNPFEGVPSVDGFYGRVNELRQLQQWLEDKYRLLIIYGICGVGKTKLIAKIITEQNELHFTRQLWQKFSYTLSLEELLVDLVIRLSPETNSLPKSQEELILKLLKELQREQTLIILDEKNLDNESRLAESYSVGYKSYCALFQQLSIENHQSCIVITTQEKPTDVTAVARNSVKALNLKGLDSEAGCQLLKANDLIFDKQSGRELIQQYSGNPLWLKLVASDIRNVFKGNVRDFLSGNSLVAPDSIKQTIIERLIKRLSNAQRDILCCLASISTPVSIDALRQELPHISFSEFVEATITLEHRSLLEKESEEDHFLFTLQPMVMKLVKRNLM